MNWGQRVRGRHWVVMELDHQLAATCETVGVLMLPVVVVVMLWTLKGG